MHDPARILIVDDNPTNRDILVTRLAMHVYDLSEAADGEEAVAAVKSRVRDLVLPDVMMPILNGIDGCRLLKNDPTLPFIPIILLTAKADTKDVTAGLDAGADEYLTKPVDQGALVSRVRAMLRLKAQWRRWCYFGKRCPELSIALVMVEDRRSLNRRLACVSIVFFSGLASSIVRSRLNEVLS
jgi:DNA-binding response OmpR family regulator